METAKQRVRKQQRWLQNHGGDVACQNLLVLLADIYPQLAQKIASNEECSSKMLEDVKQDFDDGSRQREDIANQLVQQGHALERLRIQSILLRGISLGVIRLWLCTGMVHADNMRPV